MKVALLSGILFFWMLSPESLVLVGNTAGAAPLGFLLLLAAGACLTATGSVLLADHHQSAGCANITGIGTLLSWNGARCTLGVSAIVGTALFASTGILVSAGFTFNEVFFYRFPNFAFSFLLLVLVVIVHQLPARMTALLQGGMVSIAIICLVALSVAGIITAPVTVGEERAATMWPWADGLPLLLVLVGFEQHFARTGVSISRRTALLVFFAAVGLLCTWGMVSVRFAGLERLVSSSVPYMTAATGIMGQPGRMVMGCAIIAGSYAVVSGLFSLSRNYLAGVTGNETNPFLYRGVPVLLGILVGIMWLMGVAGNPLIELFIRGTLLLWLLYGAIMVLTLITSAQISVLKRCLAGLSGGPLALSVIVMAWYYGHYRTMGLFLAGVLTGALLCIIVVLLVHGTQASHRRKLTNQEIVI